MDKHKYKPGDVLVHVASEEKFVVLSQIQPDPDRDRGIEAPWYLVRSGLDQDDPSRDYIRKRFCEFELKLYRPEEKKIQNS